MGSLPRLVASPAGGVGPEGSTHLMPDDLHIVGGEHAVELRHKASERRVHRRLLPEAPQPIRAFVEQGRQGRQLGLAQRGETIQVAHRTE